MKIGFRQGLVRYQTDTGNNPTFLLYSGGVVSLIVSPDPTLVSFAHGFDGDYLIEESQSVIGAWPGPFNPGQDYWLYWDIDILTGERTFGHTTIEPVDGSIAPSPVNDQHWFDITTSTHKVVVQGRWQDRIRCFAGKLAGGGLLVPYTTGTQVGFTNTVNAGFLLFDDDGKPVKKFDRFGRGKFITTETPLSSQHARLANFRLEASLVDAKAAEFIPEYHCVTYKAVGEIGLAVYDTPGLPAIGIIREDMYVGETRTFISRGYITNTTWNWTDFPGTKLFVGETGEITTTVPQRNSIQRVGIIVSPDTILVDIQPLIRLINA